MPGSSTNTRGSTKGKAAAGQNKKQSIASTAKSVPPPSSVARRPVDSTKDDYCVTPVSIRYMKAVCCFVLLCTNKSIL